MRCCPKASKCLDIDIKYLLCVGKAPNTQENTMQCASLPSWNLIQKAIYNMIRLQTSRNKDNSNNMFNHSFLFLFEERLYTKGAHPKVNRHSIAKVRPLQLSLQTFGTWNTSKHSLLTRRSDMNLEQLWEPQNAFGDMGVSENRGTPKSSHFNEVFHFKPSILGFSPYFRFNIHMWSTSEFVEKKWSFWILGRGDAPQQNSGKLS